MVFRTRSVCCLGIKSNIAASSVNTFTAAGSQGFSSSVCSTTREPVWSMLIESCRNDKPFTKYTYFLFFLARSPSLHRPCVNHPSTFFSLAPSGRASNWWSAQEAEYVGSGPVGIFTPSCHPIRQYDLCPQDGSYNQRQSFKK